jgi:predicted PurR-regulated permease PerM
MQQTNLIRYAAILFIISVTVLGLILARTVLVPLALSVFFAYLIYPIVARLEQWGVNRGLSVLVVIFLSLCVISLVILLVSVRISSIDVDLVQVKERVDTKVDDLILLMGDRLGLNSHSLNRFFSRVSESVFSIWESKLGTLFSATTTTIFQIFVLPVYTFFLLYYRTKTAHFILRLVSRKNRGTVIRILREISRIATRYMGGLLMVVFILAVLNSLGLVIIGVPHALLFGIGAAVLNLIPYIGAFVGGLAPILYVFFTQEDPFQMMLQVLLLFLFVQFLENNLFTPGIVGNNIKINPFAIIFSLLVANLIWGIAGMVVVVPFLAIAKTIMRNVDELKPFAFLISDRGVEKYRVNFRGRFYNLLKKLGRRA